MKFANETLFLVFSLILSGLFISALPYFRQRKVSNFNNIWLLALGLNILAFLCFASASTISPFLLTIANTSFFAGYFFLGASHWMIQILLIFALWIKMETPSAKRTNSLVIQR